MSSEFLADPKYKFIAGHGDVEHEGRLSDAAAEGYRVKLITYSPEGSANGRELVVLMEREPDSKPDAARS